MQLVVLKYLDWGVDTISFPLTSLSQKYGLHARVCECVCVFVWADLSTSGYSAYLPSNCPSPNLSIPTLLTKGCQ